jgi:hypothetical protein
MLRQLTLASAVAALLVGIVPVSHAETRPDLSGTWIVESVDIQRPQGDGGQRTGDRRGGGRFGGGFGGGRRGGGQAAGGAGGDRRGGGDIRPASFQKGDHLTLKQTEDALIVTDEGTSRMSSYAFDGHETKNPGAGDSSTKSKAHWDGVALVVESTQSVSTGRGDFTIENRQIWSLSPESILTLATRAKMPRGTTTTTVTFARSDAH